MPDTVRLRQNVEYAVGLDRFAEAGSRRRLDVSPRIGSRRTFTMILELCNHQRRRCVRLRARFRVERHADGAGEGHSYWMSG